jgi:hypothetical protein
MNSAVSGDDGLEHDLSVITEIRNDFAHAPRPMAFEVQSIADQCATLRVLPDMKNISPACVTRRSSVNCSRGFSTSLVRTLLL